MAHLTRPAPNSDRGRRYRTDRILARCGVGAGLFGALHAVVLSLYPPAVAETSYSFPFRSRAFGLSQGFLFTRDLGLAALFAVLLRTHVSHRRVARCGLVASALSMLALAVLEIVSVVVEDSVGVGAWYGFASFGVGLGMIITGAVAARSSRDSAWLRILPLTIGLYVFAVLAPGILVGFRTGQLAVGGWMLLFALLGRAVLDTATTRRRDLTHRAQS